MSYKIVYGPMPDVPKVRKGGTLRLRMLTAVFLLLFVFLVGQAWPEGREVLRRCLIPGEPTVTEALFADMLSEIRAGEPVEEAVTAFCRELMEYGIQERS